MGTEEMHSLIVLNARSLKSQLLSKIKVSASPRGVLDPCFFQLLLATSNQSLTPYRLNCSVCAEPLLVSLLKWGL